MYSLTDRGKTKPLYIDLSQRDPHTLGDIVGSLNLITISMTQIKHVQRVDVHSRIVVDVRDGEKILHLANIESSFFLDLADDALLTALPVIHKAAWQVKGIFSRLFATSCD